MADEERAKLNLVLAYALNSLFYIFLRTQNVNPANHPVRKELQRVQAYMEKLKSATVAAAGVEAGGNGGSNNVVAPAVAVVVTEADQVAAKNLLQSLSVGVIADAVNEETGPSSSSDKKQKKKKSKKKSKRDRE